MKSFVKIAMVTAMGGMLWACQPEELNVQPVEETTLDLNVMAQEVVQLLSAPGVRQPLLDQLAQNPAGITLESALNVTQAEGPAAKALQARVDASNASLANGNMPEEVIIPEMFLVAPASYNVEDLLVTFPAANEDAKTVTAYTLDGQTVTLDAIERPEVPVIVVENHGHFAFQKEVVFMNILLQRAGLQTANHTSPLAIRTENGLETTKLNQVRLNNDHEPWTKGAAEVYAITSGVRNTNRDAEVAIVDMPYLDHDGTNYYPNQILLFWADYAYAAANIHFYEKDSGYNYQDLVVILINGIADITGTLTGQPYITALGQIASAVVQAMPTDWYSDDDDYVDVLYTIEKNASYTNYYGASSNARVSMAPYFLPAN